MESIIASVIGGLLSIVAVLVGHYLRKKEAGEKENHSAPAVTAPQPIATTNHAPTASVEPTSVPVPAVPVSKSARSPWRKTLIGILLLFVDLLLLFVVPDTFALNTTDPWWENLFTFLIMGVLPIYGIYLFFAGIYGGIREFFI